MLQGTIDAGIVPVSFAAFLRASTVALSSAALAFDHPANGVPSSPGNAIAPLARRSPIA
jgi:hypothetical protein